MVIGSVRVHCPVLCAPMAGVTDAVFRRLCREKGCELPAAEMISDMALTCGNRRTLNMLRIDDADHPLVVQLCGSDPGTMARAAGLAQERGADIVDINMGCPTPKIVGNGEGAALMRDPVRAATIVAAVAAAVDVPVTVKMRSGWEAAPVGAMPAAVDLARRVVEAGAAAVTVHGRTRDQFYHGRADWRVIAAVKQAVDVPVIGNGDVVDGPSARRMRAETGCDAVMVGRASLGNPWIFAEVCHFLRTGECLPRPSWEQRLDVALRHLELLAAEKGEDRGVREMRKHVAWYTKGMPAAAALRRRAFAERTVAGMRSLLLDYGRRFPFGGDGHEGVSPLHTRG